MTVALNSHVHRFYFFWALIKLHAFSSVDSCKWTRQNINFATTNDVRRRKKKKHGEKERMRPKETFLFRFYLPMAFYRFIWVFSFACDETVKWPFLIRHERLTARKSHFPNTYIHIYISMKMWAAQFKHFGKWLKGAKQRNMYDDVKKATKTNAKMNIYYNYNSVIFLLFLVIFFLSV